MNKINSNIKKGSSIHLEDPIKTTMFLEQVITMKNAVGWCAAILVTLLPISYGVGGWKQRIDDKFELHQKQTELNEARTQLTLEFNEKLIKLERENARLESLLEVYKGKEMKNGK